MVAFVIIAILSLGVVVFSQRVPGITYRLNELGTKVEQLERKANGASLSQADQQTLKDLAAQTDILDKTNNLPKDTSQALHDLTTRITALQTSTVAGPAGPTGATGAQGEQGEQGAQGATGPSGTATCDYGICLSLQNSSPGTQETGSINISDDAIIGGSVSAAVFSGNGSAISSLNASQLATGTVNDSRLSSNVTLQGNSFNGSSQLVQTTAGGLLPVLSGANLTNIDAATLQGNASSYYTNAGNLSSGTLSDGRLSSNVALLNAPNTFTNTVLLSAAGTALSVTNNASIGGTLQVTGLATLGSLSVTGNASVTGSLTYGTTLSSSCAGLTGYIWVPGSAKFGTLPGFCVMQYEAKNDGSGNAVSTATGAPWVSISQRTAQDKAQAACAGCHLISEAEWMTIAENALFVNANWSGGVVGSGCLFRGNVGNNDACSYDGGDPESGTGRNTKARFTLSNGSELWDISGNVWEWSNSWVQGREEPNDGDDGFEWNEYTAITEFKGLQYLNPSNRGWTSTQGIGRIYSDGTSTNNTQYGFLRGGNWYNTTSAGAFALDLSTAPAYTSTSIGFRVAR